MQDHQVQMDYASNTVIFNNLKSTQMCDEPKTTVETVCSVVISQVSEKVINVKIGDHYKWQTSIIEPGANLSNKRSAMARCIVSPKSNVVMCELLNPTLESVYLRRCSKIGTIEPIDLNKGQTVVCSLASRTDVNERDERPPLQSS